MPQFLWPLKKAHESLRPPPRLTVSQWADTHRKLSSEDSAATGQWRTGDAEYLRGIMDAVTDPGIEEIVILKSAQVGGTQVLLNILGYFIDQDPSPVMWVTTSLGDAETFSRDRFEPFRRDNPRISARIGDPKGRDGGNTILDKRFAGGRLLFRGANSAPSLRSHPIRIVIMDEVDGYPETTSEGEPTKLAKRRTTAFWNRKIVMCSTPGVKSSPQRVTKATSRIYQAYLASDRRVFMVPCPHCGEKQPLVWGGPTTPHGVKWSKTEDGAHLPDTAGYLCRNKACGTVWTDVEKNDAVREGKWEPQGRNPRIAGFHINEIYSPFKRMAETAREFLEAKGDPQAMKEWQQQAMAEPYEEKGEAPEWEPIYRRRQPFRMGVVPILPGCPPFCILSAGVDVQDDRLEAGLLAWNRRKQSVLVDYRVLRGEPGTDSRDEGVWLALGELLAKDWLHESGATLPIRVMCVDRGGHRAAQVDAFVGRHPQPAAGPAGVIARRPRTVVATIGRDSWKARVLGSSWLDGKKRRRQALVVTIGSSYLKSELHTGLKQPWPSDEEIRRGGLHPPGSHHVSEEMGEGYFHQLTAERVVTFRERGAVRQRFEQTGPNEALDIAALARVGAHMVGIDHFTDREWRGWEEMVAPPQAPEVFIQPEPAAESRPASVKVGRRRIHQSSWQ